MEEQNRTFEATPETAAYLNALRMYELFRNAFYCALAEDYGETQGETIYNDAAPHFEAIAGIISKQLTRSMLQTFAETVPAAHKI